MPSVLVDTNVALPALLSPRSVPRKFWVLLAFGALTYEVEHARLELDALVAEAEAAGGRVGGLEQAEDRVARPADRRAALAEVLPHGTPEDWVAVGSAPLFDEYERKLREVGPKIDPNFSDDDVRRLNRQAQAVCVAASPDFDLTAVPSLTRDPDDDAIVYSALLADVDLLVSDDQDVVPDDEAHFYEHGEHRVLAVTFHRLIANHCDGIDWKAIDGSFLAVAYE